MLYAVPKKRFSFPTNIIYMLVSKLSLIGAYVCDTVGVYKNLRPRTALQKLKSRCLSTEKNRSC